MCVGRREQNECDIDIVTSVFWRIVAITMIVMFRCIIVSCMRCEQWQWQCDIQEMLSKVAFFRLSSITHLVQTFVFFKFRPKYGSRCYYQSAMKLWNFGDNPWHDSISPHSTFNLDWCDSHYHHWKDCRCKHCKFWQAFGQVSSRFRPKLRISFLFVFTMLIFAISFVFSSKTNSLGH